METSKIILKWFLSHWLKLLFLLCLVYTLVTPLILAFFGKSAEAGIVAVTGIICMVFTQLDKFAEFSGLGFKGKMREIDEVKNKAYASIETMRNLAKILTKLSMDGIAESGIGSYHPYEYHITNRKIIVGLLHEMGVTEKEADEAVESFDLYVEIDLGVNIRDKLFRLKGVDKPMQKRIQETVDFSNMMRVASTETFWELVRDLNMAEDPEVIDLIKNLEYYREHHELRRPEIME